MIQPDWFVWTDGVSNDGCCTFLQAGREGGGSHHQASILSPCSSPASVTPPGTMYILHAVLLHRFSSHKSPPWSGLHGCPPRLGEDSPHPERPNDPVLAISFGTTPGSTRLPPLSIRFRKGTRSGGIPIRKGGSQVEEGQTDGAQAFAGKELRTRKLVPWRPLLGRSRT